jgi:hypothetical protein
MVYIYYNYKDLICNIISSGCFHAKLKRTADIRVHKELYHSPPRLPQNR